VSYRTRAPLARRSARAAAGFSLVELMMVVIIIGIISGVAAVSWKKILPAEELHAEVRVLAERILGARSDAISRSGEFWMWYDLDKQRYWVSTPFREGGGRAAAQRYEEAIEEDMKEDELGRSAIFLTKLPPGVRIDQVIVDGVEYRAGQVVVVFDALGTSSSHTILLTQPAFDRSFTLEVQGLTGLIAFHDGVYERDEATDEDFD
jgi:prepilin-type N-terminal cleavage/methylation domain-containing protein